jgi:hypothetical protein
LLHLVVPDQLHIASLPEDKLLVFQQGIPNHKEEDNVVDVAQEEAG